MWIVSKSKFEILHPRPEHFLGIQTLCRKVYPFSKPWSLDQLAAHRAYFPDGQWIVIDTGSGAIVGLAFSLIISWEDYSRQDNWQDFTSGGFFHNHNPKLGKTLYGAEVMTDPEYRGQGIGRMLYHARQEIIKKYELKRIRAGARLIGYAKYKDTMGPVDYVKKVVAKEIYDPTLSFQLSHGFKVLDVAKNYLFNDPDSLGYAAVIEWLNPKYTTEETLAKQESKWKTLSSGDRYVPELLPKELRRLVRKTTFLLGQVITTSEGEFFFRKVEKYRHLLKKTRKESIEPELASLMKQLKRERRQDRKKLAHAFALQLELVNTCETAYRTWRLRQTVNPQPLSSKVRLTFVLTAHPTEARNHAVIEILQNVGQSMLDGLQNHFRFDEDRISTNLNLLWKIPLSQKHSPTVEDEADYILNSALSVPLTNSLLSDRQGYEVRLRTWVGGDKDGHPGVNSEVMLNSFSQSRRNILGTLESYLDEVLFTLDRFSDEVKVPRGDKLSLQKLLKELGSLKIVKPGDGDKIKKWQIKYRKFLKQSNPFVQGHFKIKKINLLFEMFPALVLPIELREDANQIKKALGDSTAPIFQMLQTLSKTSGSLGVGTYARGLVVSNTEGMQDIANATELIYKTTQRRELIVIPLFESLEALLNARKIIRSFLSQKKHLEVVTRHWKCKFEVMLGYSDSAKQNGVLSSRYLIQTAMFEIEKLLSSYKLRPVFFHGSGGSVARGGGSLREQVAWWCDSAIKNPKMTVQGEMITRTFVTPEILDAQCIHMSRESLRRKRQKYIFRVDEILKKFAFATQRHYRELIENKNQLHHLLEASPYRYLDLFKTGSRPSKRPGVGPATVESLRAIPWVLCWTQTRILLPTWWGIGSAWKSLDEKERSHLIEKAKKDPFLSSFVKSLGFTLAKVQIDVWEVYLRELGQNDKELAAKVRNEFKLAVKCAQDLSQERKLVWYRPWLEESIKLRSPHIHLLNLLQIIAMQENDEALLKETMVGIACGMLTTG